MLAGNNAAVRTMLAAAGLAASLHLAAPRAGAQTLDSKPTPAPSATASVSDRIDAAAELLNKGRVVQARAILTPLTTGSSALSLTDAERSRALTLLTAAARRLKSLSPVEVSVQTADAALMESDLRTAEMHARAVIDAPKATNEQAGRAREVLLAVESRRAELAPSVAGILVSAVEAFNEGRLSQSKAGLAMVQRSGLRLDAAQSELLAEYQSKIIDAEGRANAGMMQPGVIKPSEERQPAVKPVEAPASQPPPRAAEPGVDPIEQARKFEAQSILLEADQAFDERKLNDALGRYSRLKGQFSAYLTADQLRHVDERIAETRVQLGAGTGADVKSFIDNQNLIKQKTKAEFENYMSQAGSALSAGNIENARTFGAQAGLTLNSGREALSEGEFEALSGRQRDLMMEIARAEESIRQAEARRTAEELASQTQQNQLTQQQQKQRRITEAINRVRALQSEMKYQEALQVVDQILFLDPINPTGLLLREVLTDASVFKDYNHIKQREHQGIAFQRRDNQDAIVPPIGLINYPNDWPQLSYRRGTPTAFADSEENRRTLALLDTKRIPVKFEDNALADVLDFFQKVTQLNVNVDWQSLESVGVEREKPISLTLTNVPVRTALERVLERASDSPESGAAWAINDGVLTIASREQINRTKALVIYDIRDLIIDVPDYTQAPEFDLQSVLQSRRGGGGRSPFRDNQQNNNRDDRRTLEERTDELLKIITTNVDSAGWQDNGGDVGFIQRFQGNLIITNTPANHRAIDGLLRKLREVRAMQINVETRFLLVSQDFFEQIGVDIDVYFNGNNNQVRAARATVPSTRPSDFFDFTRGGYRGGTFQPISADLNRSNTVGDIATEGGVAIFPGTARPSPLSPIGAGSNSLGQTESLVAGDFAAGILSRAPALGVAGQFLDDIQVDFLVKATQADRRTVTLTAPRLTFTNGQVSNIYVATQVSFVSDLTPVVSESAVGFDPTLDVVNEGVRMLVEGTVSADRRYVTLNVDASVAKIESFANQAITAVAGGQLVNSAQTQSFIQLPTTTVTRVQTTVTVPDQGTILLGGQRLITESEVESGVPVLSKIPILNRFFSNRIESKEEQTLLILLKPSILIQNEEEERAYPGLNQAVTSGFGG